MAAQLDRVSTRLAPNGLIVRGVCQALPDDNLPDGSRYRGIILIGNVDEVMWRCFEGRQKDDNPHPLDDWCRRVVAPIAAEFDCRALFPFEGPPYWPFQRWAARADNVHPSPIGPMIHPTYGLWHAYRAALLTEDEISTGEEAGESPCLACSDQPCLTTCPVDAFSPGGYDVSACVDHITSPAGEDCLELGCRARRACPVGQDRVYSPAQAAFHMHAFLRANR